MSIDDVLEPTPLTMSMIDQLTDSFSETNWIIGALPTDNYWSNATKKNLIRLKSDLREVQRELRRLIAKRGTIDSIQAYRPPFNNYELLGLAGQIQQNIPVLHPARDDDAGHVRQFAYEEGRVEIHGLTYDLEHAQDWLVQIEEALAASAKK